MAMTLTIKQVPDRLVERLRRRAQANRRSQQAELLLMLERALDNSANAGGIAEPPHPVYHAQPAAPKQAARKSRTKATPSDSGRLDLDALWQRARKLGAASAPESAAIIRNDRDDRHGR